MEEQNKCNKYEGLFVFNDEEKFKEHLEQCPDCQKEHEKYIKVSKLVKDVAPAYLAKVQKERMMKSVKKLACCMIAFAGLSTFTVYKIYDNHNYQTNFSNDSYVSEMGLPTDEYGFLEI